MASNLLVLEDGLYSLTDFSGGDEALQEVTTSTVSVESGEVIESFTFRNIERFYKEVESEGLYDCSNAVCID